MLTLVTAAASTLSREERIRLALNATVLETLSPAAGVMALIYLFFVFAHPFALPWSMAMPLMALKAVSVPILFLTRRAILRGRIPPSRAHIPSLVKPFRENEIFQIFARLLGTRFTWEDEAAAPAEREIAAASFRGSEPDWVARFRRTLADGDLDEALKLAAEIEPRDPDLAHAVHQRLRSFRFDEIEAALGGDGD